MKKKLVAILMICSSLANAQKLTWSSPVALTSSIGFTSPQVAVSNSTPIVTVGNQSTGDLYATQYVGGVFTNPIKLNPSGFALSISNDNGPRLAASGDTVYVTYLDQLETEVYLQRSFDGGLTFSDTIRVGEMAANIPQYASVAIMNGGNPVISFASLTSTFQNPQYVVTKSYNGGSTFQPIVSATASLGADPCDCCAGSVTVNGNKVAVTYRNSANDLRDMRAAISLDTASSFNTLGEIDSKGWIIASCPISGGQSIILGDTLISCFMNGIVGTTTYVSALNINTNVLGFETPIFSPAGVGAQDLSTIAGSGDTVGIAWTQQIGSSRNILFSYSTIGASGLGINIDTVDLTLPNSVHSNPDLAFANGTFCLVFRDNFSSNIYYTQAAVNSPSGINAHSNVGFNLALDYSSSSLNINASAAINAPTLISITDLKGNLIEKIALSKLAPSQIVNLNHPLTNGLYLVTLSTNGFNVSKKLIVSN